MNALIQYKYLSFVIALLSVLHKGSCFSSKNLCKSRFALHVNAVSHKAVVQSGDFKITSTDDTSILDNSDLIALANEIRLSDTESGWGNGKHPTTRLCLKFLNENITPGCSVLDYGTGSGILSILAAKLGASRVLAVDVDYECIRAAIDNININNVSNIIDVVHTREIYVGDDRFERSDVTVANILPGPLTRLVAPLWYLTKPQGLLCLSGMRPDQLPAVKRVYLPYIDDTNEVIEEDTHEIWGDWVSWTVRTRDLDETSRKTLFQQLTEDSMME